MKELDFDENGLATIYTAYRYKDQDIVMNPFMHFGEPIVAANRYTAQTLYRAAIAEGGIDKAARMYDVPESAVETAYRYFNQELGAAA